MKLVIVEGPTSTGKSNIARYLAKELGINLILKDDYKEKEFDKLKGRPKYSALRRIEKESWQVIFNSIKESVQKDESLIIEGNFFYKHRRKIKKLLKSDTEIKEIYCHANGFVIFKRYIGRNKSGERHPGHRDSLWYWIVFFESFTIWLEYYTRPLRLTKNILKIDTTDFSKVNYQEIKQYVKS